MLLSLVGFATAIGVAEAQSGLTLRSVLPQGRIAEIDDAPATLDQEVKVGAVQPPREEQAPLRRDQE